MITAQEVREKAKEFAKIQEQEQLKIEEEQLEKIEKQILEAIESDAETTTLIVDCLCYNNLVKLEQLGFYCENIGAISCSGYYYEISWNK